MTLGEILRNHLSSSGQQQQEAAMAWLAAWEKETTTVPKPTTVTSRLNELLADKAKGVRFFFETEDRRGELLFDVLEVPPSERAELRGQAEEFLANGGRPAPRLVVDVSGWTDDRASCDVLFEQIEREFFAEKRLAPSVLVLTDAQYRWLPRTIDELGVEFVRVATAADGAKRAAERATKRALLVGSGGGVPLERWLAATFGGVALQLEPEDGLARYLDAGRLPAPAPVRHALDELGFEPLPESAPPDALERRQLMVALADEDRAEELGSPEARLGLALALGVTATSTARERLEAELAALTKSTGLEPEAGSATSLDALLARAARRPVGPTLMRVGDELHLINPEGDELPAHARLHVHRITCKEAAIVRLHEALETFGEDDWAEDRLSLGLLHELDPEGAERTLFLHARQTLMANESWFRNPAQPAGDWRAALSSLLASEPPAAELRLAVTGEVADGTGLGLLARPFAISADELAQCEDLPKAFRCPPIGPLRIGRGDTWWLVAFAQPSHDHKASRLSFVRGVGWHVDHLDARRGGSQDSWVPDYFVPVMPEALTADAWLDAVEASPAFGASHDATLAHFKSDLEFMPHRDAQHDWAPERGMIPASTWQEADRHLALAWMALREGVANAKATVLHDGTVLLQLRAGIVAEVVARDGDSSDTTSAALSLPIKYDKSPYGTRSPWEVGSLTTMVETHSAHTYGYGWTSLGYSLPRGLQLCGHGWKVDVTFRASPFFLSGDVPPAVVPVGALDDD